MRKLLNKRVRKLMEYLLNYIEKTEEMENRNRENKYINLSL